MDFLEIARHLSALIAMVALGIGLGAMLRPKVMSEGYGLPMDGRGLGYVRALGVRDVFVGLVMCLLYLREDWLSLGWTCLALSTVAACDFAIVWRAQNKKTALTHMAGLIFLIPYGLFLLLTI